MKDALGHGSNPRGTGAQGMKLVKSYTQGAHGAKVYKNPEFSENVVKFFPNGQYRSQADYHTNDLADAHATAFAELKRMSGSSVVEPVYSRGRALDAAAKDALSSGTSKSNPAPIHDSMAASIDRGHAMRTAGDGGHVPGFKMDSQTAKRVSDAEGSMSRLAATFKQGDNRHGEYGRNVREAFDRHAEVHAKLTGGKKRSIYD